ncbi:DUF3488 and transglutaminase-like domain-containing protein [Nocardiopsis algeriensis]|uniref:Transglutaminase-like putative cysteine protease n=1 Tax=Nocardiopsis algeriensis TaxID=1478215 RepID=A0A841ITG1_9ACTN|nr:DUF3488 and transglutaminase-like domain-containing protein [Nocardiopsis algeriensis]MBB6121452.1 transglutaminase-like putative cysteine protease [Nocardiopsis algeriensis]
MPLSTLVCLLSALPLLSALVHGGGWWFPAAVLMCAAAAVSALYRLVGRSSLPVPFLQLLAVTLLMAPLFASHVAPLGLLPSGAVLEHVAELLFQGAVTIDRGLPPVPATAGVKLLIALLFTLFLLSSDFLAVTARCPGMVGGPLLLLAAIPLFVGDGGLSWLPVAVCVLGFLQLLAVDMWLRGREWGMRVPDREGGRFLGAAYRAGWAGLVSGAALLLALAVPLAVPSLRSDVLHSMGQGTYTGRSEDAITTTHPLVSMRRELMSSHDRTVLTYRTEAENPGYLRRHVLNEFDGENWTMLPLDASADTRVAGELPPPAGQEPAPEGRTVSTRISLDSDTPSTEFLPLPYWARSVEISGEWYVDPQSLMVFTTEAPPTGLSFTVEALDPRVSAEDLAGSGAPRALRGDHLSLPGGLDPQVRTLTDAVTANADSDYARALALQKFFTSGEFSYSLAPPAVPQGSDPLLHFLTVDKVGYCQQFAGAMAVMARQAGIPARVAVGYTAGERLNDGSWKVTTGDAHAWPELYFEGAGWVRFEPTPAGSSGQGSASAPEYTADGRAPEVPDEPGEEASGSPGEPSPEESGRESPPEEDRPSSPSQESERPEEEPTDPAAASDADTGPGTGAGMPRWLPVSGALAAVLLLAAAPALVRAALRRSRTAALPGPAGTGAHTAWRELHDTCLDLGILWSAAESPRAVAERLVQVRDPKGAPLPEEAREALRRLAAAEEEARYAPAAPGGEGLRADLCTAVAALEAASPAGVRLRARLLPRSLLVRRPGAVPSPA